MIYTGTKIHDAIDAWAESQVDADIAESIKNNREYNEKYGGRPNYSGGKTPWPTTPEAFDREDVRNQIAESFYDEMPDAGIELPGLGLATKVDSFGGEGQGEDLWLIFKIGDQHYKADHYYASYDGCEPWHGNCSIFPVMGKEVTVTKWVKLP